MVDGGIKEVWLSLASKDLVWADGIETGEVSRL